MRMTNKIMQNNSLYNINQTKMAEDKYTTQMTSQSKIDRPSDDPVVAIRALRLRTNVTEVTQYYEKNAPDAEQWLDVTAGALTTVTDILTNLYKQAEKGFNKDLKADDLQVIVDQMNAYTKEFYATGNQDYAGRYIFTGYRTDMELTFSEPSTTSYTITERFGLEDLDVFNYTDDSVLEKSDTLATADETQIANTDLHRLRLSYKDIDPSELVIRVINEDGSTAYNSNGTVVFHHTTPALSFDYALNAITTDREKDPADQTRLSYYTSDTGEIFLTDAAYQQIEAALLAGKKVEVTYSKDSWQEGDLHPEHFFSCIEHKETGDIAYNSDFDVNKEINYDVGYNQKIQVNTNANEVFIHDLYRDMDDLSKAVDELEKVESLKEELEQKLSSTSEASLDYSKIQNQLDAATKAYDYIRENVKNLFSGQITKYQDYLDKTNLAITKNGTRSSRLELISSRLMDQQATYKELQEENEGVDMTETAVKLASAKLTYDAALQATGKILQNSLMNYI